MKKRNITFTFIFYYKNRRTFFSELWSVRLKSVLRGVILRKDDACTRGHGPVVAGSSIFSLNDRLFKLGIWSKRGTWIKRRANNTPRRTDVCITSVKASLGSILQSPSVLFFEFFMQAGGWTVALGAHLTCFWNDWKQKKHDTFSSIFLCAESIIEGLLRSRCWARKRLHTCRNTRNQGETLTNWLLVACQFRYKSQLICSALLKTCCLW